MNLFKEYNINFEEIKRIMRLTDWEVNVVVDNDIECVAQVTAQSVRNDAIIQINENEIESRNDLIDSLFHELLHIQHKQVDELFYSITQEFDSKKLTLLADNQYSELMEKYTDNMARTLTALYLMNDNEGDTNAK